MKYSGYEKALSSARLVKYKKACSGDVFKAMTLYRHNIRLCQKFYGILNTFEVVLRNAIDAHYKSYFSEVDWIMKQLSVGGMLETAPMAKEVSSIIVKLKQNNKYSNDRVVSSVSFGFWTYLFTKTPFRLGGQSVLNILPARTKGMGQKAIFNELKQIKEFRNKIAHHEAICFNNIGAKDTTYARNEYLLIQKYIKFLGYNPQELLYGLDIFPDSILNKIDNL